MTDLFEKEAVKFLVELRRTWPAVADDVDKQHDVSALMKALNSAQLLLLAIAMQSPVGIVSQTVNISAQERATPLNLTVADPFTVPTQSRHLSSANEVSSVRPRVRVARISVSAGSVVLLP